MRPRTKLLARAAFIATLAVAASAGISLALEGASQFGSWGFDRSGLNLQGSPGDSFYDYASGGWEARSVIPPDRSFFGAFDTLRDRTQEEVHAIIEDAAKSQASPSTESGKIGALYRSFMDEPRLEELDAAPIASELARIREAGTKDEIAVLMGRSRGGFGASFFSLGVGEDQKDPTKSSLYASQSGLGLPDRDYYLRPAYRDKKAQYGDYIARMLEMIGWDEPRRHADDIVALETQIAEASWSRAESRDPVKTYNPVNAADFDAHAPGFPWLRWLEAAQAGQAGRIVVRQSSAFARLAKIFAAAPIDTLQAWAAFHLVDQTAPYLSRRFVEARFAFRNRELTGQQQDRERWRSAVQLVNTSLGEAVGKEYVARYFPPAAKAKVSELAVRVKAALRVRIERVAWMTPQTKDKALEKLALLGTKIGYPNKWRDYSALKIDPADLLGNVRRASEFHWTSALAKLKAPVDPDEWDMTPQTVNAYYNPSRNEIVFPAAILQAPFFDPNADMAINYGGIGGVIGHEMTHGFDDQGRKWDGHGVLVEWWERPDAARFQAEAAKYGAQFDTYSVAPGVNVNGALTMGENIADLGGILLALDAYRASLNGTPAPVLDGYTGEQRVFLGWAQVWRSKARLDALKRQVASDPHSPARFRVDGPMRNIDAWYDAWGVKPGDKLYLKPEDRVHIW